MTEQLRSLLGPGVRRVLVDGGSGAGKTTFAQRLCERWSHWCGEQVQLVSLDDFYPGWHGLAAASRIVSDDVLREQRPGYRRHDWERGGPGSWVALDAARPMLVEGCGALTAASAARADLTLWFELDPATRRRRALSRPDGEAYAPWWEVWAEQERRHWEADRPAELADFVIHP